MSAPIAVVRLVLLAMCLSLAGGAASHTDPPRISPFEGLRWASDTTPIVQVSGTWYECLAINNVNVTDIMAHSRTNHRGREQKRFGEDLPQLLTEMGHEPKRHVTLSLRDVEADKVVTLADVEMTEANRQAIWTANNAANRRPGPARRINRVEREHAEGVPEQFAPLVKRVHELAAGSVLSPDHAAEDLDQLEWHLLDQHSYLTLRDVDVPAALDAIRAGVGDGIRHNDFATQIQKFIALLGDGHAGVRGVERNYLAGCTDFLISDEGKRIVAFLEDRSGFLDDEHPYIRRINGVPIEKWMDAAGGFVARGSPQLIRKRSARMLRYIVAVGRELDIDVKDHIEVELESEDGTSTRTVRVPLRSTKPIYGPGPPSEAKLLEGDLGYIRIARMSRDSASDVLTAMEEVEFAGALIIDVRGNGGGTRDALRALFPYVMAPDEEPFVANVAKYRLSNTFDRDHLAARFMYRADDPIWNEEQRRAIALFAADFEPEWSLPEEAFSDWHYFLLDRSLNPGAFHYTGTAIILMDTGCFSATDIFLGAFKGRPNVTLMGTPSGGGSGRTRSVRLANSGIEIRLSSMVSFQPNGELYDGSGIQPDIVVDPKAHEFLHHGDELFHAAFNHLVKLRLHRDDR